MVKIWHTAKCRRMTADERLKQNEFHMQVHGLDLAFQKPTQA